FCGCCTGLAAIRFAPFVGGGGQPRSWSAQLSGTLDRPVFCRAVCSNTTAMKPLTSILLFVAAGTVACAGCQQGPFQPAAKQANAANVLAPQSQAIASQVQDLNRRVSQLDLNNADLHRQLAQAEQARQTSQEQVSLLQKQLGEMANRLKDTQLAKQEAEKQVNAIQASTRARGGATITANNSIRQSLALVTIPGLDVRQDGEVIRVEVPS